MFLQLRQGFVPPGPFDAKTSWVPKCLLHGHTRLLRELVHSGLAARMNTRVLREWVHKLVARMRQASVKQPPERAEIDTEHRTREISINEKGPRWNLVGGWHPDMSLNISHCY
jgi:hypothetical protein